MKGRESGVIVSQANFDGMAMALAANANRYGHAWSFGVSCSMPGRGGAWCVVFRKSLVPYGHYVVATYTTKCEAEQAAAELTLEAALG